MMYCIPENEVTGNFPVKSECMVSVRAKTCVNVLLSIVVSAIRCVVSVGSVSRSANNAVNRFVEFCPCLI